MGIGCSSWASPLGLTNRHRHLASSPVPAQGGPGDHPWPAGTLWKGGVFLGPCGANLLGMQVCVCRRWGWKLTEDLLGGTDSVPEWLRARVGHRMSPHQAAEAGVPMAPNPATHLYLSSA